MGGKTSAKSKNAYREKAYDRIYMVVPKGLKQIFQQEAEETGFPSLNSYINYCIKEEIRSRKGLERPEEIKKAEYIKALLPDIPLKRILYVGNDVFLKMSLVKLLKEDEIEVFFPTEEDIYEKASFDAVILENNPIDMAEPVKDLEHYKELIKKEGLFLWFLDTEKNYRLLDFAKECLDQADSLNEYYFKDTDFHQHEPWAYVLGWKIAEMDEWYNEILQHREEIIRSYFDAFFYLL